MACKRSRADFFDDGSDIPFEDLADFTTGKVLSSVDVLTTVADMLRSDPLIKGPVASFSEKMIRQVVSDMEQLRELIPGRLLTTRRDLNTAE